MTERTWKSHFHARWMIATVVIAMCVLGLTHLPAEAIPRALHADGLDKVEHVVAYGLLTCSFVLSLRRPVHLVLLVGGLVALAVIGALDETTQPWSHRTASIGDYASDLLGMALSCVVLLVVRRCGSRGAPAPARVPGSRPRQASSEPGQSER